LAREERFPKKNSVVLESLPQAQYHRKNAHLKLLPNKEFDFPTPFCHSGATNRDFSSSNSKFDNSAILKPISIFLGQIDQEHDTNPRIPEPLLSMSS
jgi:hypothetical protein